MEKKILVGLIPLVGLMLVLSLSGCVEEKPVELQEVNVGLSWIHNAQFAGLYWADQYSLYEEQGLKVNLIPYNYEDLAQELVDGTYDFVFLQTDTLLQAKENGLSVKAVFTDYRLMPTVYFSKEENNITKPQNLINKTVGVAYSERYPLIAMLNNVGINVSNVTIVDREYDYGWLANDTYDVEAGWVNDGLLVTEAVGEYNMIRPYEHGVNWYADIIATTEDMINNNPEKIKGKSKNDLFKMISIGGAAFVDREVELNLEESIELIEHKLRNTKLKKEILLKKIKAIIEENSIEFIGLNADGLTEGILMCLK